MEMSFAEFKILNAVGVARPSVGKFFQAIPKIKNKIDQLSNLFCWFLWFWDVELSKNVKFLPIVCGFIGQLCCHGHDNLLTAGRGKIEAQYACFNCEAVFSLQTSPFFSLIKIFLSAHRRGATEYQAVGWKSAKSGLYFHYARPNGKCLCQLKINLTFVDPSIIVQFLQRKIQQDATVYQNFIIPFFLNKSQHVSGDTPPIIKSLKLHKQPLVLRTWKVVGRAVVGRCQVAYTTCIGRHTAHHREPKTAQAASGFAYVESCRTCSCWTLSGSVYNMFRTTHRPSSRA